MTRWTVASCARWAPRQATPAPLHAVMQGWRATLLTGCTRGHAMRPRGRPCRLTACLTVWLSHQPTRTALPGARCTPASSRSTRAPRWRASRPPPCATWCAATSWPRCWTRLRHAPCRHGAVAGTIRRAVAGWGRATGHTSHPPPRSATATPRPPHGVFPPGRRPPGAHGRPVCRLMAPMTRRAKATAKRDPAMARRVARHPCGRRPPRAADDDGDGNRSSWPPTPIWAPRTPRACAPR
jgi:hypothetical protein